MITVLQNSDHPVHTIFFDSKNREKILKVFSPEIPFFSVETFYKKKIRQESVILKNDSPAIRGMIYKVQHLVEVKEI